MTNVDLFSETNNNRYCLTKF